MYDECEPKTGTCQQTCTPAAYLQQRQVPQDLLVLRVDAQRIQIALDGITVLSVRTVQQAVHVPAHVGGEIVLQARRVGRKTGQKTQ